MRGVAVLAGELRHRRGVVAGVEAEVLGSRLGRAIGSTRASGILTSGPAGLLSRRPPGPPEVTDDRQEPAYDEPLAEAVSMRRAAYSARAITVSCGFTVTLVGNTLASHTYRLR